MAFPISPTIGQEYTIGTQTYEWNGTAWDIAGSTTADAIADKADTTYVNSQIDTVKNHTGKSALLKGTFSLSNTTSIAGMATKLYTGNGGTQSIDAGVDLATQWGDNANETYGGLVWIKNRDTTNWNVLTDTIRGATKQVYTNDTSAEGIDSTNLTGFTSSGFSVGNGSGINGSTNNIASWIFQTTHRISGTTNHGKAYTCHYNPITGFTMVKYEGSGIAGHEIPHHLGRKLSLSITKQLNTASNWWVQNNTGTLILESTNAISHNGGNSSGTSENVIAYDAGVGTYILYGWANSYYDDNGELNGNYEVGIYQGTGASGNKITTRGKPAWVMIKQLDSANSWNIHDNQRTPGYRLKADSSESETTTEYVSFQEDGFTIVNYTSANHNTSGGQYLYMVVYDNDNATGKSKFDMTSETSNIQLTDGVVSIADGVGTDGVNNSITNLGSITINPTGGFDV